MDPQFTVEIVTGGAIKEKEVPWKFAACLGSCQISSVGVAEPVLLNNCWSLCLEPIRLAHLLSQTVLKFIFYVPFNILLGMFASFYLFLSFFFFFLVLLHVYTLDGD